MKLDAKSAWKKVERASRSLAVPMLLAILGTGTLWAQSTGTFTATGNMTTARFDHTATLLPNGKVLIAGGWPSGYYGQTTLASAELYDPSTGTFTATGSMTTARSDHTATLLPNGKVLIAGGAGTSAELYDTDSATFSATGDMITAGGTATLLRDGRVLITGGFGGNRAELYDPSTGTFAPTGNMAWNFGYTATLLADGTVLFAVPMDTVSPFLAGGELYDPSTGKFSYKGAGYSLYWHTASLLMNGTVLISGGGDPDSGASTAAAEQYEPASGTFAAAGIMVACRFLHTATMLPDGTVLMAGGDGRYCPNQIFGSLGSAELYDPSRRAFAATGNMTTFRQNHTATLLNDGKVLITGGFNFRYGEGYVYHASAEIYTPPLLVPAPLLFSASSDGQGQGAILHAGTAQVASPSIPAFVGEVLEIYLTGLGDGSSVIPPQVSIGGRMAEVLFFGKAPGFAGLNQVNVRVPSGVAPGPAVPVRLSYIGRPSKEVTIAVR